MGWLKGKFEPKYPEKYQGDVNNIVYRSSWELDFFNFLDRNKNVVKWSSEEFFIEYAKPLPNEQRFTKGRYYPDVYVEFYDGKGNYKKQLIEVKPLKQLSKSKSKKSRVKEYENYTFLVNQAKWHATRRWCKLNNVEFRILTEDGLFR